MTITDEQLKKKAEDLAYYTAAQVAGSTDLIFQALLDLRQQVRKEVVEECAKTAKSLVGQEDRNPTYGPQGSHSYLIASAIRKLNGEGGEL